MSQSDWEELLLFAFQGISAAAKIALAMFLCYVAIEKIGGVLGIILGVWMAGAVYGAMNYFDYRMGLKR